MATKTAVMYCDAGDEPYVVVYSSQEDAWDKIQQTVSKRNRTAAYRALFKDEGHQGVNGYRDGMKTLYLVLDSKALDDRINDLQRAKQVLTSKE